MRLPHRSPHLLIAVFLVIVGVAFASTASAAQKRVFMAPDDHTDYFWSATDTEYEQWFITIGPTRLRVSLRNIRAGFPPMAACGSGHTKRTKHPGSFSGLSIA